MPCFKPLTAYRTLDGEIIFSEKGDCRAMELPCGRCVGCRLERSRQWAVRIMHEAKQYRDNSFVTLTYDEGNIPTDRSLDHRHFQLFMKRLRKRFGPTRFYMAGEYGETLGRPHYHACLFGLGFEDKSYHARTPSGARLYRSAELERLWPYGFSSVGELTFESAAYVARYVMKKVTGDLAEDHYKVVDMESGELHSIRPEYNCMSRRPGIGKGFVDTYMSDIYPADHVVINGKACKPPRYYDKQAEIVDPMMFEEIRIKRELEAQGRASDHTEDRLRAREQVATARLKQLKRKIA